jgi:hypothetical protein
VGLLQRVRVAVVDRPVRVADLAHPQLLVHARVPHERVAGVPPALVQGDYRQARQGGQLLEPLRHVVRVPGLAVVLAEHQVVVSPRRIAAEGASARSTPGQYRQAATHRSKVTISVSGYGPILDEYAPMARANAIVAFSCLTKCFAHAPSLG